MQHLNYTTPDEVVTRRSVGFYFSIVFSVLAFGGMAALLFALAADDGSWGPIVGGILILLVAYYYVVRYYRITPVVRVSQGGVTYKGHYYPWQEVSSVQLTGSQPMQIFGGKPTEGTKIVLKNGEIVILLMNLYSNLADVRRMLQQAMPTDTDLVIKDSLSIRPDTIREASTTTAPVTPPHWDIEDVCYVRGNSVLNMYGIFTLVFVLGSLAAAIFFAGSAGAVVFLLLGLGLGALFSMFTNYFGVSRQHILVRNVYRPWKRDKYAVQDIKQVVLASNHNGTNTMRLIFHDFKHKEIAAAGLRDADWLQLIGYMHSLNIEVVDENNFAERIKPEAKKTYRKMQWGMIGATVVTVVVGMLVLSADVDETTMIILKIGWIVFSILLMGGVIVLMARSNATKREE